MTFLSVAGLRSIESVQYTPPYLCTSVPRTFPCFTQVPALKSVHRRAWILRLSVLHDYYGMVVKEEKDRKECFSVSYIPFSLSADLVSVPKPTGSIGIVFCLGEPFRSMEQDTTMMQW